MQIQASFSICAWSIRNSFQMSFFHADNAHAKKSAHSRTVLAFGCAAVINLVAVSDVVLAQVEAVPALSSSAKPPPGKPALPTIGHPYWNELTEVQRETLRPLAASWDTMEASRKRKWLSVVQSYKSLSRTEQTILQSRMAEWAALSPQERTLARLNFAESKKVIKGEKSTKWDNYRALPSEDKKAFEEKSKSLRGAAVAPKTLPSNQLTYVPVTRHTSNSVNALPTSPPIDRKTLLPKVATPQSKASAVSN